MGLGAGREWTRAGGRAQIQQGLAAYRAWRAAKDRPYHLALLAEVSAQVGQTTEGLEAVAEALATVAESAVRWWEAELYRLKGQLLLQHAGAPPEEAEACFQQALAVARRQQAKALELRGAMSLARLWLQQGKRAEAHALLAPIYGWFTEGFDTADLQEAKALRGVGVTRRQRIRPSSPTMQVASDHNLLSLQSFHGVLAGNVHTCLLKTRIASVRKLLFGLQKAALARYGSFLPDIAATDL